MLGSWHVYHHRGGIEVVSLEDVDDRLIDRLGKSEIVSVDDDSFSKFHVVDSE